MLAELNGPVPRISLKIDLVVPVIIKDLPQAFIVLTDLILSSETPERVLQ